MKKIKYEVYDVYEVVSNEVKRLGPTRLMPEHSDGKITLLRKKLSLTIWRFHMWVVGG